MKTTYQEIGKHLEYVASMADVVTYGDLVKKFTDLPRELYPWPLHPLCAMFEELDVEDQRNGRPFRTSVVVTQETKMPGDGFFKMYELKRGQAISTSQRLSVWMSELVAVHKLFGA